MWSIVISKCVFIASVAHSPCDVDSFLYIQVSLLSERNTEDQPPICRLTVSFHSAPLRSFHFIPCQPQKLHPLNRPSSIPFLLSHPPRMKVPSRINIGNAIERRRDFRLNAGTPCISNVKPLCIWEDAVILVVQVGWIIISLKNAVKL